MGLPPLETLILNAEQHILLPILLDGNIDGGWDLSILKIVVNRNILGMLVQASYPLHTIYSTPTYPRWPIYLYRGQVC